MKKIVSVLCILAAALLMYSCASGGKEKQSSPAAGNSQTESPYKGNGGKGMSLAILIPEGNGLAEEQQYLPTLVQGVLVGDMSKYSAIKVLDRQNLEKVLKETESGIYKDEDAYGQLGEIANVDYAMMGNLTKTATGYAMQIQVVGTSKDGVGVTKASYSGNCTVAELDNFVGIRRASQELLAQMGVELTDSAKQELSGAATTGYVTAQTALSEGILAQKRGSEMTALLYYNQATGSDPALQEAVSRVSVVSANISSGKIGSDFRNDIQWRKDWINQLAEYEQFLTNYMRTHEPRFELVYNTDLQYGSKDYKTETMGIEIPIGFFTYPSWFKAIVETIKPIQDGLKATGKAKEWGLEGWFPFVDFYKRTLSFTVIFDLVNDTGKVIGSNSITLTPEWKGPTNRPSFRGSNTPEYVEPYIPLTLEAGTSGGGYSRYDTVGCTVKAEDITDALTIKVRSVNGADPQSIRNLVITAWTPTPSELKYTWEYNMVPFNIETGTLGGIIAVAGDFDEEGPRSTTIVIPSTFWGHPVIAVASRGGLLYDEKPYPSIIIGANVSLNVEVFTINGFEAFYNRNHKKAGKYTGFGKIWKYEPVNK